MHIVKASDGTAQSLSTVLGNTTDTSPDQNKALLYTGPDLNRKYTLPGQSFESTQQLVLKNGQTVPKTYITGLFPATTFTSVTPATSLHTATLSGVVMKGTNLGQVTAITIGGAAVTSLTIVDDKTITFTAPTNASAGAVNIVITSESGTVTVTNGWTYT